MNKEGCKVAMVDEERPGVTRELSSLQARIDTIKNHVMVLSERLGPVLTPEGPKNEKIVAGIPGQSSCPLALDIRGKTDEIELISKRLAGLLARLEV